MKRFLLLLILTGLLFGQDKDKPKTVISKTITKFNVEEKFGEYVYASFPFQVIKVNYNNDGLVKDSAYYNMHGELVNLGDTQAWYLGYKNYREKVAKYKFEYNENSQIMDKSHYNAEGSLVFKTKYNYDLNGRKNQYTDFDGEGKLLRKHFLKYDTNDLVIENIEYKSDGSLDDKVEYEYNSNKKIEKATAYDSDGKVSSLRKFVYNSSDLLMNEHTYKTDGSLYSKKVWKYDSLEHVNEATEYDNIGTIIHQFSEKYDDFGNTIELNSEYPEWDIKSTTFYSYNEDFTRRESLIGEREMKFGELKFVPSEKTTYEYVLLNNISSQSLEQKKNQKVENSLNGEAHQYIKSIKDSRLRNLLLRAYGFKEKKQKIPQYTSDERKFVPYDNPPQPKKGIRPVYPKSAQERGEALLMKYWCLAVRAAAG